MNTIITLESVGSALVGFGLARLNEDLKTGLLLVGFGVAVLITKAVLNHFGIPIKGK